MNNFHNINQAYKKSNSLTKLIYINIFVFVLLKIIETLLLLFKISGDFIVPYLAVPADLTQLLHHLWTPLTYMFLHEGFLHIFFNLISLYWFGKIFLMFFSEKQMVGLYLTGGLIAALFYVVAFNVFPYYEDNLHRSILLGASGSIIAIIIATAIKAPNMEMQLLFIGSIKLKYIALVVVLTSFFGITSDNGGGQLAHLGGALTGYLFIVSLYQGKDITKGINRIVNAIYNVIRPRKMKVKPNKYRTHMSDGEFNAYKAQNMAQLDRILDKIKTSGYDSLSTEEKKRLFEQGNKK